MAVNLVEVAKQLHEELRGGDWLTVVQDAPCLLQGASRTEHQSEATRFEDGTVTLALQGFESKSKRTTQRSKAHLSSGLGQDSETQFHVLQCRNLLAIVIKSLTRSKKTRNRRPELPASVAQRARRTGLSHRRQTGHRTRL